MPIHPDLGLQHSVRDTTQVSTSSSYVMHSDISRKRPKTEQWKIPNHFFKEKKQTTTKPQDRPSANLEDIFLPTHHKKHCMYLWLHQTSSTLAGPLQPLRSSRAQGLAPALPGQLPPQQVATEELWAGGEHCSSFRFKETKLSLSYQKVPLLVMAVWAMGPRTRNPRYTFKRCLKDLKTFPCVEALVRIFS